LLPALEEIQERGMLSYYYTVTPEKVPPQLRAKLHQVLDLKKLLLKISKGSGDWLSSLKLLGDNELPPGLVDE
jgi:hypothetical protein